LRRLAVVVVDGAALAPFARLLEKLFARDRW